MKINTTSDNSNISLITCDISTEQLILTSHDQNTVYLWGRLTRDDQKTWGRLIINGRVARKKCWHFTANHWESSHLYLSQAYNTRAIALQYVLISHLYYMDVTWIFMSGSWGDYDGAIGDKAGKQVTTVQNCVSTILSVFKETLEQFPLWWQNWVTIIVYGAQSRYFKKCNM